MAQHTIIDIASEVNTTTVAAVEVNPNDNNLHQIVNKSGEVLQFINPTPSDRTILQRFAEATSVFWSIHESVILHFSMFGLLFVPWVRIPALLYILYVKFYATAHRKGAVGWRSRFLRSLPVWKWSAAYYPITLYRTMPLVPNKKYIFGYHPHGISFRGAYNSFAVDGTGFSQLFPGLASTLLVTDWVFYAAGYREYALSIGLDGASKTACIGNLTKGGHDGHGMGNTITLVLGGRRELEIARPGTMEVVINIRKGFIRVAIETGADLVPVIAFGENQVFDENMPRETPWKVWYWDTLEKHLGVKPLRFWGRFGGLTPHRRPIHVVVGRAIPVCKQVNVTEPDPKYVDQLHQRYVQELVRIWDDWRDEFNVDPSVELKIVE